uniref:Matrix non-peptidase homolog 1 (inferred by orthology to a C. elegans protein) n=1 Tax=Anisakis simplex TaxID=6269 RepID=A0A0M3J418_ANISI
LLIQKYAYGNAGVVEWHDLIVEAAQNKLAGQFFNQYFTEPGVPLVRVAYQPDGVLLKQETIVAAKKANNTSSLVIPLELQTDRVKEAKQILFTAKEETFALKHNGMVVVDPHRKTYAVVVYEAQIYSRLLQCAQTNACAVVNSENMRYIAEDFCWTFLNDLIEVNDEMPTDQVKVWSEFMRLLSLTPYVKGSCACCLDKNLTKSFNVPCKWHWKDRCEHIRLVRKVQSFRNNNI